MSRTRDTLSLTRDEFPFGLFSTSHGDMHYQFYNRDVKVDGELLCCNRKVRVEFWLTRKEDGDWVRAGSYGAATMVDVKTGCDVLRGNATLAKEISEYYNIREAKDCLRDARDGWREFIRACPELLKGVFIAMARQRLSQLVGERDALQCMMNWKSDQIHLLESVAISDDPMKRWNEIWDEWPESPFSRPGGCL